MQCPSCAASLDGGARSWSCPRCGLPLRERPVTRLAFEGEAIEVAAWILLAIPSTLFVVPLPWLFAAVCRWFCRNLLFSDGARAEFRGRGGEIFGWLLLTAVGVGIGWAPFPGVHVRLVHVGNGLLLSLVGIYGQWRVLRWCVERTKLSTGERFRFHGTYWESVGWALLNALAALTIVGWGWSIAATWRWAAENTRSEKRALVFHGEGFDVLWRSLAAGVFSIPIVTIPWAQVWYARWLVSQVTIAGYYAGDDD